MQTTKSRSFFQKRKDSKLSNAKREDNETKFDRSIGYVSDSTLYPRNQKLLERLSGYLNKKTRHNYVNRWHRRFFRIKRCVLEEYKVVSLDKITKPQILSSSTRDSWCLGDATKITRHGCRVVLCVEGRNLLRLEADTDELGELWEMALRRGCMYAKYKNKELKCVSSIADTKPRAEGLSTTPTYETVSLSSDTESVTTSTHRGRIKHEDTRLVLESVFRDS